VQGFLLRLVVTASALALAAMLIPGIVVENVGTLLAAAFLLGVFNAIVRPIVVVITIPLTILTLGLFLLVINAGMLWLVSIVLPGFVLEDLGSAFMGWLICAALSTIAAWFIGPEGRYEVLITERRGR
jgi:putative membrane protein